MSDGSKIEWTDATWNPIRARHKGRPVAVGKLTREIGWHCEHVSEACRNCYAERINRRLGTGLDFKPGHRKDIEIFLDENTLLQPLKWRKPRMIFPCSMTDLFGDWVSDEMLDRIFAVMALTPQHTYQVLTKRPERMRATILRLGKSIEPLELQARSLGWTLRFEGRGLVCWPLPNVWLIVSIGDQSDADKFVPILLETPAAVRGVSYEPALGPVDLQAVDGEALDPDAAGIKINALTGGCKSEMPWHLDWVICGGESGPDARPMHPDWARSVRDQCAAASVPFFFKQWGEWARHKVRPGGDLGGDVRAGRVRIVHPTGQTDVEVSIATGGHSTIPGSRYMARVGKKAAGRLLDGVEHNGFPARA